MATIFPPLSEVRVLRQRVGLTQTELARAVGVSQSLIAKIEAGLVDPAYSTTVRVFEYLLAQGHASEFNASHVMSKKVVWVSPHTTLREAVRKFRTHAISQLPVLAHGRLVGSVSENNVLSSLAQEKEVIRVQQVMESAPPTVPSTASVRAVASLLRYCPLVAVVESGRLRGVISRSDVLVPLSER